MMESKAEEKLLEEGSAPTTAEDDDDDKDNKFGLFTKVMFGIAAGCIGVNIAAIAMVYESTIVIIAGVIAFIGGCVAIIYQLKLEDIDSLRKIQNLIRQEVNKLQAQNNILHNSVNELENQLSKLSNSEDELEGIVNKQGTNVTKFVDLVKENGKILNEQEDLVKKELMGQIISTIIKTDRNNDFIIDEKEVNELLLRIKIFPQVASVNEEELKQILTGQSLDVIIDKARGFVSDPHHKNKSHLITLSNDNKLTEDNCSEMIATM